MSSVAIFAPSPTLTVTIEEHESGDEIHIHAGGQGVWQARMLRTLGIEVTLCCAITGESGTVLRRILEDEGIAVAAVERPGRGAGYVHDRREGHREVVAEEDGDALSRHDLDELYSLTLREGLTTGLVILSGPDADSVLDADTYRRLAADLRAGGARVVVDLAGDRLRSALEGGVDVLKLSDEELTADGFTDDDVSSIQAAMRRLRDDGADTVIVTRAPEPSLLLDGDGFLEVSPPSLEIVDTRGAGDSLTAGVVAAMTRGEQPREAVTLGAAAGALNVTRHGLGTGDGEAILRLRESVAVRELSDEDRQDDSDDITEEDER
ncbi:phosphofructokinase [Labedella phragmitis]|uniref:Phosphofructokinase n=1 Tax=Labedella phragmitis TaxID=2498849 RepID=A0A3S4A286_9MICO|nr:PfkB family carbohydrate kinase [Labedella phragmitis]RWZ49803.1 phosphofructokinase [Labedella phragmitis]